MRLGNIVSELVGPDGPFKKTVFPRTTFDEAILFKSPRPVCSRPLERGGKVAEVKTNCSHLFYDWSFVAVGQAHAL